MLSIRTQCKRALVPYKNAIHIEKRGEYKWVLDTDEAQVYLGTYKTKERALEVLDEIELLLTYKRANGGNSIYQMPKE